MNAYYKSDKEPIELLLGMAGAVQYLEHSPKDELNYSVLVKTKTGSKQLTIPIEAVRLIQSKKPSDTVIESIKRQLTTDTSGPEAGPVSPDEKTTRPIRRVGSWLLGLIGVRN
ncbi:hypothetical protein EXU85_13510 [Spirosoma sp. KCTC 42546]|uniref:hypothetical protein n=1 Tax=Spirosoma sp. KCTC 42546 TaxID=2520506 RepID=UPI001158C90D|nr:hypothetical protein [Spirosoma sp. KCTC 42546]QDK79565.1 hypothetical protein EXU85_13510 [Spirosoma sp. KCTC 42546]